MTAPKCRICNHNHWGVCNDCPECKKQNDIKKGILQDLKISVCTQKQPEAKSVCTQVDKPADVYAHCQTCKYKLYYEKHRARNREAMKKKRKKEELT